MPVYHKRLKVPKAKEEIYGPIDGVRPQDHMITYNYLRHLRCCRTIGYIYEQIGTRGIKYCHSCYLNIHSVYRINFLLLTQHSLVHERIAYNGQTCVLCQRFIMTVKSAFECSDCIEEYLICSDGQMWETGNRIAVTQRWI